MGSRVGVAEVAALAAGLGEGLEFGCMVMDSSLLLTWDRHQRRVGCRAAHSADAG